MGMSDFSEIPFSFFSGPHKLYALRGRGFRYPSVGVLFLHGWGTSRSGPSALLVGLSRQVLSWGISTMRFDFTGRGYSEGSREQTKLLTMIDDVGPAIEAFRKEGGVERIILCGLCSGGEVAVGAAAKFPSIMGGILLSTPLLGRQSLKKDCGLQTPERKKYAEEYIRKLFLWQTYTKLLTGKLHFKLIRDIMLGRGTQPQNASDELSLLYSFCQLSIPLLFIYGGADPEASVAREGYSSRIGDLSRVCFKEIEGANHNFYSTNWRTEIYVFVQQWLDEYVIS